MARSQIVDYTRMRKGKAVLWDSKARVLHRIDYCPVCGRKGEMSLKHSYIDPMTGLWHSRHIIHETKNVEVAGFVMREVTDSCVERLPFQGLYNAGVQRSKATRRALRREIPDTDWPALPFIKDSK